MVLEHLLEDNAGRLNPGITREEAFALLEKYNKEQFHIQHAETVEAMMRYYARIGLRRRRRVLGFGGLAARFGF